MPAASFNSAVQSLDLPPIPMVHQWASTYDGTKGPSLDLSQAVPGYAPPQILLDWLGEASASPKYTGYGPIEGEPTLRSAYAAHVSEVYGRDIGSSQIHITSGCNQAFIATVMAIAGAGDSVLLSNPFYFNHATTLSMLGIHCKSFDLLERNGFIPTLEDLEAALDPSVKAVMLVSPNNPTGAIYPADWLQSAFELCRKKGVWLILDETYRDFLPLDMAQPHPLFQNQDWSENFIQLYSFSKSFCIPGHRLGAVIAGEKAVLEIAKVMDNLQICAPRPPQIAIAKALPQLGDWRHQNRLEIAARAATLETVMAPLDKFHIASIGSYFSYIRHGFDGVSAIEIAQQLSQQYGVTPLPGTFFGADQAQYLRFAFANVDQTSLKLLTDRLGSFQHK